MCKLFFILLFSSLSVFSQTKFTSSKYNYSFVIPDGWYVKDKIYNPDVDAKIVDGKGNSFIVSIKTFPSSTNLTIKQQMEPISTKEIAAQFDAIYGATQIVKRGTSIIDFKEVYYFHMLTPFQDGLRLYHKQFAYSYGYQVLSIDACAIENNIDETTPAFAIMINTFKFSNLKNK